MTVIDPEITAKIDRLLQTSNDNGWNSAINACRHLLPPEYSKMLRPLYRLPADYDGALARHNRKDAT